MCSYNKVALSDDGQAQGLFSCENPLSLQRDLKERMNFSGFVVSDWYATHSLGLNAGLDIEMPGAHCSWLLRLLTPDDFAILSQPASCTFQTAATIEASIKNGQLSVARVDDAVRRILTAMFAIGEVSHLQTY